LGSFASCFSLPKLHQLDLCIDAYVEHLCSVGFLNHKEQQLLGFVEPVLLEPDIGKTNLGKGAAPQSVERLGEPLPIG
jgi:hypothetical protein